MAVLEPDNGAALSLKSKIESRRSERQIENWYRLARQHIENHAYAHAREALHNVLQLKPKEARAFQLLADVERQEQEYNKVRQEKARLYRAAVDAWQKGEVSTALSKLAVVLVGCAGAALPREESQRDPKPGLGRKKWGCQEA